MSGVLAALKVFLRLLLPVLGLVAVYAAAFLTQWQYVTAFDGLVPAGDWWLIPGYWLTVGHLVIMLAFFVSMLTNRAYGAPYALGAVVLVWLALGALAGVLLPAMVAAFPGSPLPPRPVMTAFVAALGAAHLVNIILFERYRGLPWWRAPLVAGIGAAVVMAAVYWPLAKWGAAEPWFSRLVIDLSLKLALAAALMLPYYLLRRFVPPRDGLGGY